MQDLGTGQGWAKVGLLGFPKSGKSYTSAEIAIGLYRHLNLDGAIAMFDTEGGSTYLAPKLAKAGIKLMGERSRSLEKLVAMARELEQARTAQILIVDSITHPWRELCDSYLKQVNEKLEAICKKKNWNFRPQTKLEFQDWNPIKQRWAEWTDLYLNSKLHVIICGRAGFEYDYEERDDGSGKKDLVKTGIKMRTEGEFGFEPSLLVEMERVHLEQGKNKFDKLFTHRATVLGDRFGVLDGKTCDNPTYDFFKPHIDMLVPGAYAPIDTQSQTAFNISPEGDDEWKREKRQREIVLEEIQHEMVKAWPGQTKEEKKIKAETLERAFGTGSWTKVEGFDREKLVQGLEAIKEIINEQTPRTGSAA